ncbi:dienelactone hydrolase family protein [Paracoccus sp. MBLB3053]|uniref:Dienelactone hydrolase family protein n=1 Tax=Paracoccus aurantius TaxID=3073814 RepID=A0ABU2HXW4_9RHOB|nr:dienelactone hydrolase family protein [Paracoccus sp. MBLB3053]MDS9469897.1 dienelactone hydrolase family protein [Paracoccus sp. MBLB3053]
MIAEDISYSQDGLLMRGCLVAPEGAGDLPGILLVHGAHGLNGFILGIANRLAGQGHAVLALDLWGRREQLSDPARIGEKLGACVRNRAGWMSRVEVARAQLAARPEVDPDRIGALGYCFGGATVLEYARSGGDVAGVVSFHGGLDLVSDEWGTQSRGPVLICSGSDDPMATPEDLTRLTGAMSAAGVAWELDLYGGARHAFTEPDAPGRPPFARYDARADRRSWAAMSEFFNDIFS